MKNRSIYFLGLATTTILLQGCETQEYQPVVGHKYHVETDINHKQVKPDFSSFKDVQKKKKAFIDYMLESIKISNAEICGERKKLNEMIGAYNKNTELSSHQQQMLAFYSNYYKVKSTDPIEEQLADLNIKIGVTPTSFILAQAILESGWGTSRFAKDYNNYFGLHCFDEGCGVKAKDADVFLETFENADESILGYYYRLNTGSKFKDFRITRYKIKQNELPASDLLDTLEEYSELKGNEYKDRLESVISHNKLDQYDKLLQC